MMIADLSKGTIDSFDLATLNILISPLSLQVKNNLYGRKDKSGWKVRIFFRGESNKTLEESKNTWEEPKKTSEELNKTSEEKNSSSGGNKKNSHDRKSKSSRDYRS